VIDSISDLVRTFGIINDRKNIDLCLKKPTLGDKPVTELSNSEFSVFMRRWNDYIVEYFKWINVSISATTEQIAVISDFIEVLMNLISNEAEEKWLLISIAIRSQPTLLNYIQKSEK
jgi:hypothetical protein